MPLDPYAKRFLDMIGASGSKAGPSGIAEQRHAFAMLMRNAGTPAADVSRREVSLPGADGLLQARIYESDGSTSGPKPGLVFFHGGGLVAGDLDTHDGLCSVLAAAAGCGVVSVAYRLAPEHPFPAAVEDAWAATAAVLKDAETLGLDPERIAVGGDSVGANLAASISQEQVRRGLAPLRAQLLICPVLDARQEGESHRLFASGYFLDAATLARELQAYGGPSGLDLDDARVSPLRGHDLAGLPPTIIETAEYDMVRDDGATYAQRLAASGVPVQYTCHPGMIHLFYGFGRVIPYGTVALKRIGAKLAGVLGEPT